MHWKGTNQKGTDWRIPIRKVPIQLKAGAQAQICADRRTACSLPVSWMSGNYKSCIAGPSWKASSSKQCYQLNKSFFLFDCTQHANHAGGWCLATEGLSYLVSCFLRVASCHFEPTELANAQHVWTQRLLGRCQIFQENNHLSLWAMTDCLSGSTSRCCRDRPAAGAKWGLLQGMHQPLTFNTCRYKVQAQPDAAAGFCMTVLRLKSVVMAANRTVQAVPAKGCRKVSQDDPQQRIHCITAMHLSLE